MVELLKQYRECFAWDYDETPDLHRELVEHRLPIKSKAKLVKQAPRRFASEILPRIKEEVERLLKAKFIRIAKHVDWISNIVPVIKKNGKFKVCIDFIDLNSTNPMDECP